MPTDKWTLNVGERTAGAVVRTPEITAARPALLIYLTLDAERGLDEEPYAILPRAVLAAGHQVASFDLPNHGRRRDQYGEGLMGMAAAFVAGKRVFDPVIATGHALIDAWLNRTPRPGPVMVAGVSRGGLAAFHLSASDPRVVACAAFAPVTDLLTLREFSALANFAIVHEAGARALVPRLRDLPLFLTINERDERVDTAACIDFFSAVSANATQADLHRLRINPESGHTVSDADYLAGADWLLRYAESL